MISKFDKFQDILPCRLCNNKSYSGKVKVKEHSGSRIVNGNICEQCNSIIFFQNESNQNQYEERSSNDFSAKKGVILTKLRSFYRARLAKDLVKKLGDFVEENMTIIDYGAGSGDFAFSLYNSFTNSKVIAVDIAKTRPSSLPPEIDYYSLSEFQNLNIHADLFVLKHVLEHIEKPIDSIIEVSSKLKQGGKIYIEVPFTESTWRRILGKYWAGYYWPFHLFVPSLDGLQYLSDRTNLKIESSYNVEVPIFGSSLMHTFLPYQMAVIIGILLYPFQFLISKLSGGSEAIGIVVSKIK